MTATFVLTARGPFSLATSTGFLEGFAPAAYTGMAGQPLEAAFPVAGTWQTAGVRVREHPGGVECEIVSPAAPGRELLAALRAQVARILSLDVDGSGFPALAERDPVIAGLRARYPGPQPGRLLVPVRGRRLGRHRPAHPDPSGRRDQGRQLQRISSNWRPYRTWATLLLRVFLEEQTHEIADQPA